MSSITTAPTMTSEELLALPDDGIDREIIRGQLREREMTRRYRRHSRATARLARFLDSWLDSQGGKGEILSGDAAFRLARDPESCVGIDLAYISEELSQKSPDVYRPGAPEVLFAASQELIGEPELPGFRVKVADIFSR